MEFQINHDVHGKTQVIFEEETEFGPFRSALYYTPEEWSGIPEHVWQGEARKQTDAWITRVRASNIAPSPYQVAPAKVLILFGAGASYGALGIAPSAPPLGPRLFESLCQMFPATWAKVSGRVAEIFMEGNPENGMAALNDEASGYRSVLRFLIRDMAVYFSRFEVQDASANLYCRLVLRFKEQILNGDVVLSTLNYECLIEHAMETHGIVPTYLGEVASGSARILKVHGSCNFIPQGFLAGGTGLAFDWSYENTISTTLKFVHRTAVRAELEKTGIPSAMSMYTENKPNPIGPLALKRLRDDFAGYCKSAGAIVAVGARPYAPDTHIWQPIADSRATISLVADRASCDEWILSHGGGRAKWMGDRFDAAWDDIVASVAVGLR
ncbi:MAG: hypothetical protein ABI672_18345 [Vicinamibacteria bacterium]